MPWFPTAEWLDEYERRLNDDEEYAEMAADYGTDFDGDYIFAIEDLPIHENHVSDIPDEMLALENMPDDAFEGFPESLQEQILDQMGDTPIHQLSDQLPDEIKDELPPEIEQALEDTERMFEEDPTQAESVEYITDEMRDFMPEQLATLIEQLEYVDEDGTVYTYIGLEAGECTGTEILGSPGERDAGFMLRGKYEDWKDMVEGMDVVQAVMSGKLEIEGEMNQLLEYAESAQRMGDISSDIEADYIF
jgi:putative sterol carrier protein